MSSTRATQTPVDSVNIMYYYDNMTLAPLGVSEHPRVYVSRIYQRWMDITGSIGSKLSNLEQVFVRGKVEVGLPVEVQSGLLEVVGLDNMNRAVYTDHVTHYVNLYREKIIAQSEEEQETLRKLNRIRVNKHMRAITDSQLMPPRVSQAAPLPYTPLPGVRPPRRQGPGHVSRQRAPSACYICGKLTHLWRQCGDRLSTQ